MSLCKSNKMTDELGGGQQAEVVPSWGVCQGKTVNMEKSHKSATFNSR